jgi:hypothetical protein
MENCIHRIESRTATAGRCLRESIISFGFICQQFGFRLSHEFFRL